MSLGGAQQNTLYTVRGLDEDPKYSVELLTGPPEGPEGELLEEARSHGIEPVLIDNLKRNVDPVNDLLALFKLYRYFARNQFDLVHTHSSKAGILARWASFLAGVPRIMHTIHGLPFHRYQPPWRYWLFWLLEVATAAITQEIVTVCDRMAEKASIAGVTPRSGFTTVYSGMDLEPFLEVPEKGSEQALRQKQRMGFPADSFVFGKIARLFHLKGHKYALRAFSKVREQVPEVRLLLVGDGILREKLEQRCKSLGIEEDVKFTGLVPARDIPSMISTMDCLIHVSLREGLPRVIPQAQAAGRPVISYDVDGAPEAIEDGKTGFLVEPETVDPLAKKMIRVIEDTDLRECMVGKARNWVEPRFDWRHMVSEIKSVYE